jgi:hypothetical protein
MEYFVFLTAATALIAIGWVWSLCLGARARLRLDSGLLPRIFAAMAPWVFTPYLPPLLRLRKAQRRGSREINTGRSAPAWPACQAPVPARLET